MNDVINLLNMHHHFFFCAKKYADLTKQPTPEDSRISLEWYSKKESGLIRSANFQLHAPINKNSDVFTNQCGSLQYPLLFNAVWTGETYKIEYYNPDAITNGYCKNI